MYDQGGHTYKFDWNPNNITWYTDAAGGLSHVYSADIVLDYASPAWLQCMPADVEIRVCEYCRVAQVDENIIFLTSRFTHVALVFPDELVESGRSESSAQLGEPSEDSSCH